MKELLKSYLSFTRRERMGLVILLALLLTLVLVKATMQFWVRPAKDSAQQQKLVAVWNAYKQEAASNTQQRHYASTDSNKVSVPVAETRTERVKTTEHNTFHQRQEGVLFPFDPNTLDSVGFRKLGLREKTTAILLHWRNKGKVFRHKEELKKVYTLTEEDYQRLEPYIRIKG